MLAFEMQERDLVERIEGAQPGIALEAIDDARRAVGPDVLGAQVAMGVDGPALADAGGKSFAVKGGKALLRREDPSDGVQRQLEARIAQRGPAELVLAAPVAPTEAITDLRPELDDLVCLDVAGPFGAIGCFYRDFSQVSDEEVVATLARFPSGAPPAGT